MMYNILGDEFMKEIIIRNFKQIVDERCQCDVKHKLVDVLILIMCAVLCGIDTLSDIVEYGEQKIEMLREQFGINKIPSEATLCRILNMINAELLAICIVNIMKEAIGENSSIIAIDGKAICSTDTMKSYTRGLRIVTAYMVENGVSIGQLAVDSKSNEIPCVRELIDLINLENKIVTTDAEHCQKETVAKIIENKGDYCVCLKANQKQLYDDVKLYFEGILGGEFTCEKASVSEKNRERHERRTCYVFKDISWLNSNAEWVGLKTIFAIERKVSTNEKITNEVSFYISSLETTAEEYLNIVRKHWKIESLHWQLDVVFDEDKCRVISENGQKSLNMFRKIALAIHKNYKEQTKHKKSIKKFMLSCLLNDDYLLDVIELQ